MGCDIHCYIEYKAATDEKWRDFGQRINPGRNYNLFAKMAGLRTNQPDRQIIPKRGLPTDLGYYSNSDAFLFVVDHNTDSENCVSREKAEKWIAQGYCNYIDEEKKYISHPDWHSHSWCSAKELEQVLEREQEVEYGAVLSLLKYFEQKGYESRLVFWFDN